MKNRRLKMIAPLLTLVFAIGGAFATNALDKAESFAMVPGYIDAPTPCQEPPVTCSDIDNNILCRDESGTQAFAKDDPEATTCTVEVYRLEQ